MKTIEQAARDALNEYPSYVVNAASVLSVFHKGFAMGVEFAQRWIPVSEELPEDGEIVLITIEDCHIDVVVGIFNGKEWMCRLYVPTGHTDFIIYGIDKVTHWRPIEYK